MTIHLTPNYNRMCVPRIITCFLSRLRGLICVCLPSLQARRQSMRFLWWFFFSWVLLMHPKFFLNFSGCCWFLLVGQCNGRLPSFARTQRLLRSYPQKCWNRHYQGVCCFRAHAQTTCLTSPVSVFKNQGLWTLYVQGAGLL